MVIDRIHTQTYLWVEKCIHSCKTHDQLRNATNLISLYEDRLKELVRNGKASYGSLMFINMLGITWEDQERFIAKTEREGK